MAQAVELNIFTGLALFNDNEEDVTVVVRAYTKDGVLRDTLTLAMEPGTRIVDLLDGEKFFGPTFAQAGGHLQIISSRQLHVFALFGGLDLKFMSAIEAQELYH